MILALLAVLGAIVVGFILFPLFVRADADAVLDYAPNEREWLDLSEKKAQLLESIKDLDFEKESGKVSDADYEAARNDYMTQVAELIARIDEVAPVAAAPASAPTAPAGPACASCGTANPETAKFCIECGTPMSTACGQCGESLKPTAKFCSECGAPVEGVTA